LEVVSKVGRQYNAFAVASLQPSFAPPHLNHLTDLSHLLPATSDVVVSDVVHALLLLPLHWLSLAVDDGVRGNDTVGGRISLHDLELDGVHGLADEEKVALLDGAVSLEEVGLEIDVEKVSSNTLDSVVEGEDVDALSVRDVAAGGDGDDIREANAEILTNDLVHPHVGILTRIVSKHNADSVLSLLSLDQYGVSAEELEFLHLGGGERDHGVVIISSLEGAGGSGGGGREAGGCEMNVVRC